MEPFAPRRPWEGDAGRLRSNVERWALVVVDEFVLDDIGESQPREPPRQEPCIRAHKGTRPNSRVASYNGGGKTVERSNESAWRSRMTNSHHAQATQGGKRCHVGRAKMVEMARNVEVVPVPAEQERRSTSSVRQKKTDNAGFADSVAQALKQGSRIGNVLERVPATDDVERAALDTKRSSHRQRSPRSPALEPPQPPPPRSRFQRPANPQRAPEQASRRLPHPTSSRVPRVTSAGG